MTRLKRFLYIAGPGIVVMLADTDVGSIITAAQSGLTYHYELLVLQILLIPVLYCVQELSVRLAIFTERGQIELIRHHLGSTWAGISACALIVAAWGALITEFTGVVGVGELYQWGRGLLLVLTVLFFLGVVLTGSYRRVEKILLILGLFEFCFFILTWRTYREGQLTMTLLLPSSWGEPHFKMMVAANIGAVIMPWMIFYQQSATVDKQLKAEHFAEARLDTALGAMITQMIVMAVMVSLAQIRGDGQPVNTLTSVADLYQSFQPYLGTGGGRFIFSGGIVGSGLLAGLVVSLASAWGFGELLGYRHALERHPFKVPLFYCSYVLVIVSAASLVYLVHDLVWLSLMIEVLNALLLPFVLGTLVYLSATTLPSEHRVKGGYLYFMIILVIVMTIFSLWGATSVWAVND